MVDRTITFEFRGVARERDAEEKEPLGERVDYLNSESPRIARRIATEVQFSLPGGVNVDATIRFRSGSIEWIGAITLLNWMGFAGGAIEFVEYAAKAIQFAVDRVVREEITRFGRRHPVIVDYSDTSVTARSLPRDGLIASFSPQASLGKSLWPLRWIVGLLLLDSLLLIVLLVIVVGRFGG